MTEITSGSADVVQSVEDIGFPCAIEAEYAIKTIRKIQFQLAVVPEIPQLKGTDE